MTKVAILMSTYNGEDYLQQQIDSIRVQNFTDWELFIRDDGSKDRTVAIIKENVHRDSRINYVNDVAQNLGPKKSFFKLLKNIEADYYFFCDQDDVWVKNKLTTMLNFMENQEKTFREPLLVYCGLRCVDGNLEVINNDFENIIGKLAKPYNRFIGNDMPGVVMLFNRKVREIFLKTNDYDEIEMHDWWIALIAAMFGKVIFIDEKLVLYRQHGRNTVGAGTNGGILKKFFKSGTLKKQDKLINVSFRQSRAFFEQYKKSLNREQRQFLRELMLCESSSMAQRYRFFKKYDLQGTSSLRTLVYKWLFIIRLTKILKTDYS
ncbi:glycosyltransferase family 2 protein [Ligilactobacillus animalis]|uniref:glycosyltransferase family 2 protein n=1 Tax=Ligilactobacillus animalis TaxID=1605 RepID=UPI0010A57245|nr:glycosyltransferase family 2 protein [Ligilactobacillus animalis]MDO5883751.1 glycosyltransferase family 2 protein [Ligilactobacillus animalis]MDU8986429.1 glycosyltransferase family 2 protein [Ligilactobacillus animalis]